MVISFQGLFNVKPACFLFVFLILVAKNEFYLSVKKLLAIELRGNGKERLNVYHVNFFSDLAIEKPRLF